MFTSQNDGFVVAEPSGGPFFLFNGPQTRHHHHPEGFMKIPPAPSLRSFTALAISLVALLTIPSPIRAQSAVGLALDAPEFLWVAGGDGPWGPIFNDASLTHDGEDVLYSYVGENEVSWFETTVPGPGTLSFWWKISTVNNSDGMDLTIDGIEQTNLVGNADWQEVQLTFPANIHTLRWTYRTSMPRSEDDSAYVDQVSLQLNGQPYLYVTPQAFQGFSGSNYVLHAPARGASPLQYRWFRDGAPVGNDSPSLDILNFSSGQTGAYTVMVSNSYGAITSSVATISFFPDAIEATSLIWQSSGDALWFAQTETTHDGVDAAQSGYLEASSSVRVSTLDAIVTGPGILKFWWRADFAVADGSLAFYIDGEYQTSLDLPTDWNEQTYSLADGGHTIRWEFGLSGGLAGPGNQGFLDQVSFVPQPRLRTERSNSDITLSWGTEYSGYTLEATGALGSGIWNPVSLTGINTATIAMAGPQLFFRLRKP